MCPDPSRWGWAKGHSPLPGQRRTAPCQGGFLLPSQAGQGVGRGQGLVVVGGGGGRWWRWEERTGSPPGRFPTEDERKTTMVVVGPSLSLVWGGGHCLSDPETLLQKPGRLAVPEFRQFARELFPTFSRPDRAEPTLLRSPPCQGKGLPGCRGTRWSHFHPKGTEASLSVAPEREKTQPWLDLMSPEI